MFEDFSAAVLVPKGDEVIFQFLDHISVVGCSFRINNVEYSLLWNDETMTKALTLGGVDTRSISRIEPFRVLPLVVAC